MADTKMVTLSKSTLSELSIIISCLNIHLTCIILNDSYFLMPPNDRGILSKPIQFFDKLQELLGAPKVDSQ